MVGYRSTTAHALGIICNLNTKDAELVNAVYLSEQVGVTHSYVMRIIEQLKKAGLVDSVQGRHGGFFLARPAETISLYEVICAMEEPGCRTQPTEDGNRGFYQNKMHRVLVQVNETVKEQLSKVYISEIA